MAAPVCWGTQSARKRIPPKGRAATRRSSTGPSGWSPATGPKSVQAAYAKGLDLVFEWGDTSPFNYDFFIVRWDLDGKNVGQQDIDGRLTHQRPMGHAPRYVGRYRLVVEGADGHPGGSKSQQGWSNSLYVDFVVPPPIRHQV